MSRVDELQAQLALAILEDQLAEVKDSGDGDALEEHKAEVRYARWVARGGPQEEQDALATTGSHTNRATEALYARWSTEQLEG